MNDHESDAKAVAYHKYVRSGLTAFAIFSTGWNTGRMYEPPAVCGHKRGPHTSACVLLAEHDGGHQGPSAPDGSYTGWPR